QPDEPGRPGGDGLPLPGHRREADNHRQAQPADAAVRGRGDRGDPVGGAFSSSKQGVRSMAAPSLYRRHPGHDMLVNWEATLKERTGRSLPEWIALLRAEGPPTEREQREWLKSLHHLPTNTAWWVAERAAGRGAPDDYDPE